MKSNIFIPKRINVGFQNRSDTYTKKLAYVIYFDEKEKLRKEASWQSWRDNKIPNEVFDNVPTEGFVLNKKVGDYASGWNHRQAYCRIYDPRNFEFEITIENLLYNLENTNSIKGKGLEGEFVYAWDGKDLVLIPIESPDYKEIAEYNAIVHNNQTIKAKDLIVGATYLTKDNHERIYMGKYDFYSSGYKWMEDGEYKISKLSRDIPYEINRWGGRQDIDYRYISNYPYGKYFWFAKKYDDSWSFEQYKSIPSGKFIKCTEDKCTQFYGEIFELMEGSYNYSPIDDSKDVLCNFTLDEFKNIGMRYYTNESPHYTSFKFISSITGKNESYLIDPKRNEDNYLIKQYTRQEKNKFTWGYSVGFEDTDIFEDRATLEEIYNTMKPLYIQRYLKNGREYEKEYSL